MTRKDHLVQLVAGLGSWTPSEGKTEHAVGLLAEIEKVCPEETSILGDVLAIVAQTAAVERERCAKIAEELVASQSLMGWADFGDEIAAAIRRGGA